MSGSGALPCPRSWMKWISSPATGARKWEKRLIAASCARQSNPVCQCWTKRRKNAGLVPDSQLLLSSASGSCTFARRSRRSARTASGTFTSNGWTDMFVSTVVRKSGGQLAEERRDVFCVELRLLERGKVAAPRHLGPALDVQRALGELARRASAHVLGKQGEPDR